MRIAGKMDRYTLAFNEELRFQPYALAGDVLLEEYTPFATAASTSLGFLLAPAHVSVHSDGSDLMSRRVSHQISSPTHFVVAEHRHCLVSVVECRT